MKRICVLGAGEKPLLSDNIKTFRGVECSEVYEAVNVDCRNLPTTDIVFNLSNSSWWELGGDYDIVLAEHVAEHIPNRIQFVKHCGGILKKGGLLIIEVPNWKNESAHNTLEHCSTWGRSIFDNEQYCKGILVREKTEYRISFFWGKIEFYIGNEFIGRMIDRFIGSYISAFRFYLRASV